MDHRGFFLSFRKNALLQRSHVALLSFAFGLSGQAAVPLQSTIGIFGYGDLARCSDQVRKAARLGNKRLNFLPTLYFKRVDTSDHMEQFCERREGVTCVSPTAHSIADWKAGYSKCFAVARYYGIQVAVMPHLDDFDMNYWRNNLYIDPLAKYRGLSYYEVVLRPFLEALSESRMGNDEILLGMMGEMGTSVFAYSASFRLLAHQIRSDFPQLNLKIGVGLNHNVLGGQGRQYTERQREQTTALLNEVDFVGISAYTPQTEKIRAKHFELNITRFLEELKTLHGISLPRSKELHFTEIALGGGSAANDGTAVAATAMEAANALYSGINGDYNPALDPWRQSYLRDFRSLFYVKLIEYLQMKTSYNLRAAFLWNVASWDVQGLYPGFESYGDAEVTEMIRNYNLTAEFKD